MTTLIAGIGNIFLGDDGFGVEVVRRLATVTLPADVRVRDFGIRGIHLAYELLDGNYDRTILVDAAPRGGKPGTLYVIEPEFREREISTPADAHAMDAGAVFAALKTLGGTPGYVRIVGCEPASIEEGMELSAPVAAAVDAAVQLVRDLVTREAAEAA
jgi:hydrogenase maturation protease